MCGICRRRKQTHHTYAKKCHRAISRTFGTAGDQVTLAKRFVKKKKGYTSAWFTPPRLPTDRQTAAVIQRARGANSINV